MTDGHYTNALAEIALALAMAFFSIMVLAMISMGAGFQAEQTGPTGVVAGIAVSPSAAAATTSRPQSSRDTVVLYHNGAYYDPKLNRIDPAALRATGRIVLAINPALSVTKAIEARSRFAAKNLVVTTLDQRWLKAFKEIEK